MLSCTATSVPTASTSAELERGRDDLAIAPAPEDVEQPLPRRDACARPRPAGRCGRRAAAGSASSRTSLTGCRGAGGSSPGSPSRASRCASVFMRCTVAQPSRYSISVMPAGEASTERSRSVPSPSAASTIRRVTIACETRTTVAPSCAASSSARPWPPARRPRRPSHPRPAGQCGDQLTTPRTPRESAPRSRPGSARPRPRSPSRGRPAPGGRRACEARRSAPPRPGRAAAGWRRPPRRRRRRASGPLPRTGGAPAVERHVARAGVPPLTGVLRFTVAYGEEPDRLHNPVILSPCPSDTRHARRPQADRHATCSRLGSHGASAARLRPHPRLKHRRATHGARGP